MMVSEPADLDVDERRCRFKAALKENRHTAASIAKAAGLTSANTLYNFLNGTSKGLKLETWMKLAPELPKSNMIYVIGKHLPDRRRLLEAGLTEKTADRQRQRAHQQSAKAVDEIRRAVVAIHGALGICSEHIAMLDARLSDLAE